MESLQRLEFESWWPRYETTVKKSSLRNYYRGVFPSYVFVNFDTAFSDWKRVCSVFGVRRVLGASESGASALPQGWVEAMIETSPTGIMEAPKTIGTVFKYGDTLKITDGPLAGRIGTFQHSEKGRVSMLLSLLSRETSVIIPAHQVTYTDAAFVKSA